MEPQVIIYQEKYKRRWVAEVIDIDNLIAATGSLLWRGEFDSKEEARVAAQREVEKKAEILKIPLFQIDLSMVDY